MPLGHLTAVPHMLLIANRIHRARRPHIAEWVLAGLGLTVAGMAVGFAITKPFCGADCQHDL